MKTLQVPLGLWVFSGEGGGGGGFRPTGDIYVQVRCNRVASFLSILICRKLDRA